MESVLPIERRCILNLRDFAEDVIGVVLQMYNVPESLSVPITPVLDEVEKIIIQALQKARDEGWIASDKLIDPSDTEPGRKF